MALTQTDLDNLDAAIASSELEVQVDGKLVKYRSTSELLKARNHVQQVLASTGADGGGVKRARAFKYSFATGRE